MKPRKLPLLLSLLPLAVLAGNADLADVPLMNITGSTTVHPNILLMVDNSGSMGQDYTPDYVNDSGFNYCRSSSGWNASCVAGDPPYMSPDFNKQYYNPNISYEPPIKVDGTSYTSMTRANTSAWTSVPTDGFGKQNTDMLGTSKTTANLVTPSTTMSGSSPTTGFPDRVWCKTSGDAPGSANCVTNASDYSYPNSTFGTTGTVKFIGGAPYYYQISVGEYCTDSTLSNCQSTTLGANAPGGYPVPAKVRWCNTLAQTTNAAAGAAGCQAKKIDNSANVSGVTKYQYVRYSYSVISSSYSYGTLAIGASATNNTGMQITSVTAGGTAITNGAVSAPAGTQTLAAQQDVANKVAASIVARNNSYTACVDHPTAAGVGVVACSTYGITLGADNVLAIIPLTAPAPGGTPYTDSTKAGVAIVANANTITITAAQPAVPPTGLIQLAGTSTSSTKIAGSSTSPAIQVGTGSYGKAYTSNIQPGSAKTAIQFASYIAGLTPASGSNIKFYVGGNTITPTCAAQPATTVCLVDNNSGATNGKSVTIGAVSNAGTLTLAPVATAGGQASTTAVTDKIPTTPGNVQAGSATTASPFKRVNIVPFQADGVTPQTYPNNGARADCITTPGICTYDEEMTNFANWFAYYRTRLQTMKSAITLSFHPIMPTSVTSPNTFDYRVGFARLSNVGFGGSIDLYPDDVATQRSTLWSTVTNLTPSGSTPLRTALDRIGAMFQDTTHVNADGSKGVITSLCQQNFLIITTDGYWNDSYTGSATNNDTTASSSPNASRFCTRSNGCLDGMSSSVVSLADHALYWYNGGSNTGTNSLRPDLEPNMGVPGVVPTSTSDPNTHLHLTTYTMGLGVSGQVTYDPTYDTTPVVGGDFYKIVTGATNCPWNANGRYDWPVPVSNAETAVDDLWHTAINGHGRYYSAADPSEVVSGLQGAIQNMAVRQGAASAAATSTPNVTILNNDIYSATFTTVKWYGELVDQKIDPNTGAVSTAVTWSTTNTLGAQDPSQPVTYSAPSGSPPARKFWMLDTAAGQLKEFKYANTTTTGESAWFQNKCSQLTQCGSLAAVDQAIVNDGNNLVNYLRGVTTYADDYHFRAYTMSTAATPLPIVLGDIDSAKPAYVGTAPLRPYSQTATKALAAVYTAANDGMLHAFAANSGYELWAYVPRITMPKLYHLADKNYGGHHIFTVDGSPEVADAFINGGWKTVLVGGLNKGGRGFYALDITDPTTPKALWEFCADATVCAAHNDPDIGYTYGNPQIVKWQGQWVVLLTSGYNNVPGIDGINSGNGGGYLYIVDLATGALLQKVGTGVGTTSTPAGLAKLTATVANPASDPTVQYVYGGDNLGNLWRFDMTQSSVSSPVNLASLGTSQPITSRPEVAYCDAGQGNLKTVVLFGTGRLLGMTDIPDHSTQSVYVVKDSGTALGNVRSNNMVQHTLTAGSGGYTISNEAVDLNTKNGWFFDLTGNAGERVNLDPTIVFGSAQVVTNVPSSTSACTVGGTSWYYQTDLCTGTALPSYVQTGLVGLQLSNSSAAVGFIVIRLSSGAIKMIATTAEGKKVTQSLQTGQSAVPRKTGWHKLN